MPETLSAAWVRALRKMTPDLIDGTADGRGAMLREHVFAFVPQHQLGALALVNTTFREAQQRWRPRLGLKVSELHTVEGVDTALLVANLKPRANLG